MSIDARNLTVSTANISNISGISAAGDMSVLKREGGNKENALNTNDDILN